jgi:hypothetical protein
MASTAACFRKKWARGDAERVVHHKEHKAHNDDLRAIARDPFFAPFVLLVAILVAPRLRASA